MRTMKAIIHKKTGEYLVVNECDDYELSDVFGPLVNAIGTNEEILQDVEDYSDGEFKAEELQVVEFTLLTDDELESKLKEAFKAGVLLACSSPVGRSDEAINIEFNDWRNRK